MAVRKSKNLIGSADTPLAMTTSNDGTHAGKNMKGMVQSTGRSPIFRASVTGKSGTNPTLDLAIYDSADGVNFHDTGIAFTQITANGGYSKDPGRPLRPYVRLESLIGGTNTPTYTVHAWIEFEEGREGGAVGSATES